ncbi:MAG: hypothetical protein Q4C68_06760 [Moraxella sp.]|nr:hypothetical protein [Moraxella sp.]
MNSLSFVKKLAVATTASLLLAMPVAYAKTPTTKVVFAEGSYCGNYEGQINGARNFTLTILKGQTVYISSDTDYDGISSITAKNPQGKLMKDVGDSDSFAFNITKTGKHTITVKGDNYVNLKFCAY